MTGTLRIPVDEDADTGATWWIGLTVAISFAVCATCVNPVWETHRPPFGILHVSPAITAPIDGPFYLRNAEQGYSWQTRDPLSLWFHPLLPAVIRALPHAVPIQFRFYFCCVLAGIVGLVLVIRLQETWIPDEVLPNRAVPLLLATPAGLALTTGNPELVSLGLHAGLLLGLLLWRKPIIVFSCALSAILVKPNALYMVPVLVVYLIATSRPDPRELRLRAAVGILGIFTGWFAWMLIVGWHTGDIRSYWTAREVATTFVPGTPSGFVEALVRSFTDHGDLRDRVRYSTAVAVPLVNIWLAGVIPFRYEEDRYATGVGNATMLAIALIYGNPNKILLYALTLPGNLVVHLTIACGLLRRVREQWFRMIFPALLYSVYCGAMLVVFVWGTSVGWYY